MIGKQLSRWTMAWFAAALVALILALGLAVLGAVGPGNWAGGRALAVVHLFALGWLGQMMLGALIQFTPVLSAQPLALPGLALPALLFSVAGVAMLATGFLSLDGWPAAASLLAIAPFMLGLAFAFAAAMLAMTLIAARSLQASASRMVLLALAALLGVWITGTAMALALRGYAPLAPPDLLPLHILFGAGGWLSLAAMGVSYKLFAMFLLAPEEDGPLPHAIFPLAAAVLILAAGLTVGPQVMPYGLLPAAAVAILTAALYLAKIHRIWKQRRRPRPEVNMQFSLIALGFLALASLLALPAISRGGIWAEAAVFAALAGWLSTLTLAQMVKIVNFLTWIQVFAPRIGRQPVPLVHDLTDAARTRRWLVLWSAGVLGGILSLLAGAPGCFRLSAVALLVAVLGLCHEAVSIRRLRHLPAAKRPAILPPLVLPTPIPEAGP